MERIAEAHQVHQLQQGVASFGVVEHSVVAAAAAATKPRAPGLPPTPPASFAGQQRGAGGDVCMDDSSGAAGRKLQAQAMPAHRRTRSDVPFAGYFPPPTHQLPQPKAEAGGWGDGGGGADDLFSSYLNLEGMDVLNSSSPDSSAKADSSENGDSEECAAWGVKRGAAAAGVQQDLARARYELSKYQAAAAVAVSASVGCNGTPAMADFIGNTVPNCTQNFINISHSTAIGAGLGFGHDQFAAVQMLARSYEGEGAVARLGVNGGSGGGYDFGYTSGMGPVSGLGPLGGGPFLKHGTAGGDERHTAAQ